MRGVKFRAYPTAQQKRVLSQWIGCARVIYNAKCDEDKYFRTFQRKSLSLTGEKIPIDQSYSQFKGADTPWLKDCPSQILRNSAVRWYQAYQRFFQGLSGRPQRKSKSRKNSLWLTGELFRLEKEGEQWKLFIGSKTKNMGYLSFYAHRDFCLPKSITLSRERGEYYVSFSYEEVESSSDPWEVISSWVEQGEAVLAEVTQGADRGIARKLQSSTGVCYDLEEKQKKCVKHKKKRIKKNQKRLSRQQKGSKRNFAHQTSRQLVNSESQCFVLENLLIPQMTKRPAPQQDAQGKYLPNRSAAKAGLNRSILESSWGKLLLFLGYKAKEAGKLVLLISPYQSSQECAKCHHTHPDNRQSQSVFLCCLCGHLENADQNASEVLRYRGMRALLENPREHWEETSTGIWKLKTPAGTRGSAHGGKVRRQMAKSLMQSQRSA